MNKKAAFTNTFTVCRTEKISSSKQDSRSNKKEKSPRSRPDVMVVVKDAEGPADINRSMEDAAVMDSAAAYNRDTRRRRWLGSEGGGVGGSTGLGVSIK